MFAGAYWCFFLLEGRGSKAGRFALFFMDGLFLGILAFGILPKAMEAHCFYGGVSFAVAGVLLGFLSEKKTAERRTGLAVFLTVLGAAVLFLPWETRKLLGLFGGLGLYFASAGILPEGLSFREQLLYMLSSGGGFLTAVAYFC